MKLSRQIGLYALPFLLGIFYSVTVPASAPWAEITHLAIKNDQDSLLIDLKVKGELTPEMNKVMLSGVPLRFIFSISLYKVYDYWFDRKATSITVIHELRYDALKKRYKIIRSRANADPVYTKNFQKAWQLISEINGQEVISLADLAKGEHYQLMVNTVFEVKKFPFFSFYREIKTDRNAINFFY